MIRHIPTERALLQDGRHPRLVGEEEGEVRGQDAVLHVSQHLRNLRPFTGLMENPMSGIVWFFVKLIFGPCWLMIMNQLNKKPKYSLLLALAIYVGVIQGGCEEGKQL